MKFKFTVLTLFLSVSTLLNAQNFSASNIQQPTCFGACDGSVTFTTSSVTGPFTAILTNSASCPNSTVSSSTSSAITISSVCACASDYTVSIYTGTILAGVNYVQFPNYATAPLTVQASTITPASCSTCCDGQAYITWSGGNTTFTNNPPSLTLDGVSTTSYSPTQPLCVGSHTICAKDSSQCVACKVFTVSYNITTGIEENEKPEQFILYPNPAATELTIEVGSGASVNKAVIYDLTGRIVLEYFYDITPQNKVELNVSALSAGLYYVEVSGINAQSIKRSRFAKKDN